ncbi:MAG: alkaline phosphatase [Pseudohongiellaceae bacterium]|nr:alkaline phosphatase [Pseudohongiellaceae bacterium]
MTKQLLRQQTKRKLLALSCALLVSNGALAQAPASPQQWYEAGQAELSRVLEQQANTRQAKNIILFLGDGMGISTVTAARIFAGQQLGGSGEENLLSFEHFPALALSRTYNTNQQTPDSAGTMTAIITGMKTKAGLIAINQNAKRSDCASSQGQEIPSFLVQAENHGMATGIVTTTRITHATPAATYAHSPERNWESDTDVPEQAKAQGCKDIASQLIDNPIGNGIDVVYGGGRQAFIPASQSDPQDGRSGARRDGRNLIREWEALNANNRFIWNAEQLSALDANSSGNVLGLFSRPHMSYHEDRSDQDSTSQPSLPQMTLSAIELLQRNDKGFFLMVEAGRIDHAHHASNAYRALDDTKELSEAVEAALAATNAEDTLIIVTADHSHALSMGGYSTRGNPILGKVVLNDGSGEAETSPALDNDEQPYTTLSYQTGRGFAVGAGGDTRYTRPANSGHKDLVDVDTEHSDYHQETLVPLNLAAHAGEDVAIFANGPWSHLFSSSHEQNYIYHVMRHAAGFDRGR